MPTYEYVCKTCGEQLEVVQSFRDDALTTCPSCGGPLRKVFGSIGITFKGSGFYKTDNRPSSGGSRPATKETSSDGGSSPAKPDGGSTSSKPDGGSTSSKPDGGSSSRSDRSGSKSDRSGSGSGSGTKAAASS